MDRAGEGPAAVVYQASCREQGAVALKIWKGAELSGDAGFERFRKAVEANARVSHPHVARVIEAGREGTFAYLVTEFLSGRTLAEHMPGEPDFLEIAGALCRALGQLHAAGIVHGNVKPSNLIYASSGLLKLTDAVGGGRNSQYAAPEVLAGAAPTPASDIYSAAAVLREILAGVPSGAIGCALATDPADRPRTALAFLALLDSPAAPAPPPLPPAAKVNPVTTAAARTVESLLKPEPAPYKEVLPIFLAMLRHFEQLETSGYVHDPVTPQTVKLRPPDNTPGIASFARTDATISGVVPTARYGAPEVLRTGPPRSAAGRTVSTLYSTGLVLYEILAGSKLFSREFESVLARRTELSWLEWQWNVAAKPTPIGKLVPDVPAELARIVTQMIEKDPAARPQTYGEVDRVFQKLVASSRPTEEFSLPEIKAAPAPAAPPRRPWSIRDWLARALR
jgi:serine/threonine protein kinase